MFTCDCRPERHKEERLDSFSKRHALYSVGCGCGKTVTLSEWSKHLQQEREKGKE